MLEVKDLSFRYQHKEVLKELSFTLDYGNSVCLLGKNGAGKSTLFKCLLGIFESYHGNILIDGENIKQLSRKRMAAKIAYIPQNSRGIFQFTVFEMVLMGAAAQLKSYQQPKNKEHQLASEALELLKITHLKDQLFTEISGGEQQLVIIARSVAQQSKVIIMDEPCANLDYGNQVMVLDMITELTQKGYLIIQATHDPNHVLRYGDQVMVMQDGKLRAQGEPTKVLTASLLEEIYFVPVELYDIEDGKKVCVPSAKRVNIK